jgi:hypothetical protein
VWAPDVDDKALKSADGQRWSKPYISFILSFPSLLMKQMSIYKRSDKEKGCVIKESNQICLNCRDKK